MQYCNFKFRVKQLNENVLSALIKLLQIVANSNCHVAKWLTKTRTNKPACKSDLKVGKKGLYGLVIIWNLVYKSRILITMEQSSAAEILLEDEHLQNLVLSFAKILL